MRERCQGIGVTNTKSIMILGAGEGQVPLIRRARESGWKTIVVSPQGNYPGFVLADDRAFIDISDKSAVLQYAQENKISAIATDQTDISVPTVLFIAERMGLPCIQCESIDRFRLKSMMRRICAEKGISFVPYLVSNRIDEIVAFYETLPQRLAIIKPIDSQGSRGVQRITSLEGIQEAFEEARKYSQSGYIIIERYIEGSEIEVDTVVRDKQIVCTLIGDVYNFGVVNSFSAFERIYPTSLPTDVQDSIHAVNAKVIQCFGLNTGWTHGEYIVDENKNVFLLEIGARGGGNYIGSDIIREMIGVSTDEMAFCTAIGDFSFYDRVFLRDSFCAYRCFCLPEGEVISLDIAEGFLNKPFILTHNLDRIHVGFRTHKITDKTSRFTIVVKGNSREELEERLNSIEQAIRITVKTDYGVQGIIWR